MPTTPQAGREGPLQPPPTKEERSATPKATLLPVPEPVDALRRLPDPDLPKGHPYHGMKGKKLT